MTEQSKLHEALSRMQGQLTATAKGAKGQVRGNKSYAYSTIADVWDAIREPLAENGLSIVQTEDFQENWVILTTTLYHVSGKSISGRRPICTVEGAIKDPQAYGSALTYGRRYGITALVGIAPADDDDGLAAKRAAHTSQGKTAPVGARGGQDKTPAQDNEIKLFGFPEGGTRVTKSYPRNISGIAAYIDDLEMAVAHDAQAWDTNEAGIEIAIKGAKVNNRSDLTDRLANIEIAAMERAGMQQEPMSEREENVLAGG